MSLPNARSLHRRFASAEWVVTRLARAVSSAQGAKNQLPDGSVVTVLAREGDETFELDADAEAELLESIAEADRGELIPAAEVMRMLRDEE